MGYRHWSARGSPIVHQGEVTSAQFSPDGRTLLTGSLDTAQLSDVASGRPIGGPFLHKGSVRSVAFSPDGRRPHWGALTGPRLWDVATGKSVGTTMEHADCVTAVVFSPDGRSILTGSADRTARLWDAATAQPVGAPMEHKGSVAIVAFNPDGKTILTAGLDDPVLIWDVRGRLLGLPLPHVEPPPMMESPGFPRRWSETISPNGRTVLTRYDEDSGSSRTGPPVS